MAGFTISEIATKAGLSPSAIRYYERTGLLPPAMRLNGQRRYDATDVYRLSVLKRARQLGFSLRAIRELFRAAAENADAVESWRAISEGKLAELKLQICFIKEQQYAIRNILRKCHCRSLEECGRRMFSAAADEKRDY